MGDGGDGRPGKGQGSARRTEREHPLATQARTLAAVAGTGLRFASEPSAPVYLAILLALQERRLAHELEVLHDDLLAAVAPAAEALTGQGYDAAAFRGDVEALRGWGNVTERIEPTRLRSLADRGRSKLLLRLEPRTAAFLEFLEGQATPAPLGVRDEGLNLLADIEGQLVEAGRELRAAEREAAATLEPRGGGAGVAEPGTRGAPEAAATATSRERREEHLTRAAHLVREADRDAERVADELLRFGDALATFVAEPFRLAALAGLTGWLERYVERYLAVLDERGRRVRRALSILRRARFAAAWRDAAALEEERQRASPIGGGRLRPPREVLEAVGRFFEAQEGLATLCARVNRRTREAIRRIQRHVEQVRLRNVRIEALRARTAELFALPADEEGTRQARAFLERLVASAVVRTDAREGTPGARVMPPRPARRHETLRPALRALALEAKSTEPGASRALELRRLQVLSELVERLVLRGRPAALYSEAQLTELHEARRLVEAVVAFSLRCGRHRPHLGYTLEPREGRAVIEARTFVLETPELLVARRKGGR